MRVPDGPPPTQSFVSKGLRDQPSLIDWFAYGFSSVLSLPSQFLLSGSPVPSTLATSPSTLFLRSTTLARPYQSLFPCLVRPPFRFPSGFIESVSTYGIYFATYAFTVAYTTPCHCRKLLPGSKLSLIDRKLAFTDSKGVHTHLTRFWMGLLHSLVRFH